MPDKTDTARINVIVPRDIHTAARVYAVSTGMTLGELVAAALEHFVNDEPAKGRKKRG